ncbi:MAG: hypothetical protein GEU74_00855 [Nitriliruptorales bacterium]|nr:hypothetical protein [Nitriliruptorales bacterium]
MSMFLRPRWLLVHLVVAVIAVVFVNLGLWQLRRLDERRADNALIQENMAGPPRPLDATLDRYGHDPDALAYRRVVVEGTYQPRDEVLLTPRSHRSQAGHHVVTPLLLANQQGLLVNRGSVPYEDNTPPVEAAAPPTEPVQVTGVLIPTQTAARTGSAQASASRITYLSTVDVDRLQPQIDIPLYPFSVLLQQQQPAVELLPVPAPPPEVTEGSHLSYAWQWFIFTAILLLGYPLLLRRSLRAAAERGETDQSEASDPERLVRSTG